MVKLKSSKEIAKLKAGGFILSEILAKVRNKIRPKATPQELNKLAENYIKAAGAKPSFKNYKGFPAGLCVSVNEQLVHGVPTAKRLKPGDIVGIDCGIWYQGLCTDMALTVPVGKITKTAAKLLKVTKQSLVVGLKEVKPGNRSGDYGAAVQDYVERNGFAVIRDLVGHGVGYEVHEEPRLPNYGEAGEGFEFKPGMVLAFEPMVAIGDYHIRTEADGWTISMADKSLSAHFELTVLVTENGYELITPKIW